MKGSVQWEVGVGSLEELLLIHCHHLWPEWLCLGRIDWKGKRCCKSSFVFLMLFVSPFYYITLPLSKLFVLSDCQSLSK